MPKFQVHPHLMGLTTKMAPTMVPDRGNDPKRAMRSAIARISDPDTKGETGYYDPDNELPPKRTYMSDSKIKERMERKKSPTRAAYKSAMMNKKKKGK